MSNKVPYVIESVTEYINQLYREKNKSFCLKIGVDDYVKGYGGSRSKLIGITGESIKEVLDYLHTTPSKFHFVLQNREINISTNSCILDQETAKIFRGNVDRIYYQLDNISNLEVDSAELKKILPDMKIKVMFDY